MLLDLDLSKPDVRAVLGSEDQVVVIAVLPSEIKNIELAMKTLDGWLEYARKVGGEAKEALRLPEIPVAKTLEEIEEKPYTPISQADDMPGWYKPGAEVANDMNPDEDEVLPPAPIGQEWVVIIEDYNSYMFSLLKDIPLSLSSNSKAEVGGYIPTKDQAIKAMQFFLNNNKEVCIEQGWKSWHAVVIKEKLDELEKSVRRRRRGR